MPIIVCGGVSAGRGFFIFFRVCVCVCDIRQQKQQEQNKRRLLFLYSFLFAVLVIIFNAAINRSFLSLLYSTAAIQTDRSIDFVPSFIFPLRIIIYTQILLIDTSEASISSLLHTSCYHYNWNTPNQYISIGKMKSHLGDIE